jgi:hypothetical protein
MKGRVEIRRDKHFFDRWYIAGWLRFRIKKRFKSGILHNVTFEPKAKHMRGRIEYQIRCGLPRESVGTAFGTLESINEDPRVPERAVRTCTVRYSSIREVFFDHMDPGKILTSADFLVLKSDGTATAGWYE